MRFLLLSLAGDGVGIVKRLQDDGHDAAAHIYDDAAADYCKGYIKTVSDPEFQLDAETYVVADCTGHGDLLDMLRERGSFVACGGRLADRLETDREYAYDVMKDVGIKIPKTKFFEDWDEAKNYVGTQDDEERMVFKPDAHLSGNLPSYAADDPAELLEMLDYYHGRVHGKPKIVIQHFVGGEDISTEGWFNGEQFIAPFNHTLESKKFLDGDKGPSGGCTGNVIWTCEGCPLCEELRKMEEFLGSNNYGPGPIDLNAVVSEDGIFGLEFTPRLGYDAAPTFVYELFRGSGGFGDFIEALVRRSGEVELAPGYAAGIRLSIPPWPSEEFDAASGLPIQGLTPSVWEHFCPMGVMKNEHDDPVSCGSSGILGVATGYGDSVEEAFTEAYRVADKIKVPNKQQRSDLTEHFAKKHRKVVRILGAL